MIQYAYWNARQISARAVESPSGPVQINVPLRDPLLPDPEATLPALSRVRTPGTQSWDAQGVDGGDIFHDISGKRGVVVIGGMLDVADAQAWVAAAQRLGWPIIGDPATNVPVAAAGTGLGGARAEILFTALYQHESEASQALLDALEPDVILRVGRLPVSKSVVRWMKQSHAAMILIDNAGLREDETMSARILIDAHASGVRAWGEALAHAAHVQLSAAPPTWQAVWQRMDTLVNDVLAHSSLVNTLHHSSASVALTESVREGSNIVLANSNAIRHVDRYAPRRAGITYMANRGLNGIDGMISTACGVACTRPDVPTYFLTGDLGFFHDMNGLEVAARYHLPLTVVVLNNNGGGIFAFLQQARLNDDEFGALFQTPLTMDIRSVASVYRAEYSHPTTLDELRHALRHNTREQGLRIVEVSSTISDDVHVMQTVCADIALACTRLIHDHATHPDCQVKE
ncbi:MAG: thiamine pyrophosphate-dependent enzyme [Actinomycetaceae bacterium]|nr:thiamine pyrophosphate-dependent enzyme [Actinomycetaceae bacterium]MDY6082795.1 thiamine pyrophosphate-dependent enzyme [Actinomycetaceae bacterium]